MIHWSRAFFDSGQAQHGLHGFWMVSSSFNARVGISPISASSALLSTKMKILATTTPTAAATVRAEQRSDTWAMQAFCPSFPLLCCGYFGFYDGKPPKNGRLILHLNVFRRPNDRNRRKCTTFYNNKKTNVLIVQSKAIAHHDAISITCRLQTLNRPHERSQTDFNE